MLPYGRQLIEEDDIEAVTEVLRGDFLTTGPAVETFEKALCETTGAKHAVACSNGTAALHLAGMALGLKKGDAVIVPSLTFLATANAVRHCNAEVVFADVEAETGLMKPEHLEDALTRCNGLRPRAVYPVHLTGQCADLPPIKKIADRHGLKIVTDSAHALGASCHGEKAGNCVLEDMSCFSFHPVKAITMGEGGAITVNDKKLADAMRVFRSHGMVKDETKGPWFYEMQEPGYNYRATDMQCALGTSQLRKLNRFIARRAALAARYDAQLHDIAPVRVNYSGHAWHLYAARIDFAAAGTTRTAVMNELRARGIGTQVHYIPVHTQPYYLQCYGNISLPGAEQYYERTLSLPLFPGMKDEDVDFVATNLKEILEGASHAAFRTENRKVR
jgi:UDP-4-amino-4,6-dideoxy-N-acetyl-beta-L-altrosamine transaminase